MCNVYLCTDFDEVGGTLGIRVSQRQKENNEFIIRSKTEIYITTHNIFFRLISNYQKKVLVKIYLLIQSINKIYECRKALGYLWVSEVSKMGCQFNPIKYHVYSIINEACPSYLYIPNTAIFTTIFGV